MKPLTDENGEYRTGRVRVPFVARLAPSAFFYAGALYYVMKAGLLSRRGAYDDEEWCADSRGMLRRIEAVGARIEVSGAGNIRAAGGPCVFVANHMSTMETFVLPTLILPFGPVTYVIKRSLLGVPVFRHLMRNRDPVTVGRVNPREDLSAVLEGGTERLGRGISVIVFPQTTRSLRFNPAEFNSIGIKLARRAGVPVVPIALKTDAWGIGGRIKDIGKIDPSRTVHFSFGPPVRVDDKGTAAHKNTMDFIQRSLLLWEKEAG